MLIVTKSATMKKSFIRIVMALLILTVVVITSAKIISAESPTISSPSLTPELDFTKFVPYYASSSISGLTESGIANVEVKGLNGDGGSAWNYYADGTAYAERQIIKSMSYDIGLGKWKSENIYPDNIYPEIFFAPSTITWNNAPSVTTLNRNNYQLLHFSNPYTMTGQQNIWIELNAYRRSATNSADLQVYVVGKGHDITYFQNDWRNKSDIEQAGVISRLDSFNHTHSANSSHHLVSLATNENTTVGQKEIDISDDFWIILYSNSPNNARGWDFRYQTNCNVTDRWFSGSQAGWATTNQTGCPDAHVHTARRSDIGGIKDGVNLKVTAADGAFSNTSSTNLYYNQIPNLAPNSTSFTAPAVGQTIDAENITVSWDPASDANNDSLVYDIYLIDKSDDSEILIANDTANTSLSISISEGTYSLRGEIIEVGTDQTLSTNFELGGDFVIDTTDPIKTISSITIGSNNTNPNIAVTGDEVSLRFTTSTPLLSSPTVSLYIGGDTIIGSPSPSSPDNTLWQLNYAVSADDSDGIVTYHISSNELDRDYFSQEGEHDQVIVDKLPPSVRITSPNDGSQILGPFTMTTEALDAGTGVDYVELFVMDEYSGVTVYNYPFDIDLDIEGAPPGDYSLKLKAFDKLGQSSFSEPITLTIPEPEQEIVYHQLTYVAGEHGSISGYLSQTVADGADASTIIAVADSGYRFLKWSDNVETTNRTDTNISGNLTLTAYFELIPDEIDEDIDDDEEEPEDDDQVVQIPVSQITSGNQTTSSSTPSSNIRPTYDIISADTQLTKGPISITFLNQLPIGVNGINILVDEISSNKTAPDNRTILSAYRITATDQNGNPVESGFTARIIIHDDSINNGADYSVMYWDGLNWSNEGIQQVEVDYVNKQISFTTSHLSEFAIVSSLSNAKKVVAENEVEKPSSSNSIIWFVCIFIVIILMIFFIIIAKRKSRSK